MCAFLLACGCRTLGAVWVARADHDSSSGGHRRRPALQLPGDTWWDTAAAQIRAVLTASACARWYATVIDGGPHRSSPHRDGNVHDKFQLERPRCLCFSGLDHVRADSRSSIPVHDLDNPVVRPGPIEFTTLSAPAMVEFASYSGASLAWADRPNIELSPTKLRRGMSFAPTGSGQQPVVIPGAFDNGSLTSRVTASGRQRPLELAIPPVSASAQF